MKKLCYSIFASLVLILAACGSDDNNEENKADKGPKTDDADTVSVDTIEMDTTTVVIDSTEIEEVTPPPEVLGQEEKSQAASVDRKRYNLEEYTNGLYKISIELPVGSKLEWDSDYEELSITFGNDFEMVVGENLEGTIDEIKSKFKNTLHNQHLGYLKDEPNGIIKKSKANGIETHQVFYTVSAPYDMFILISSVPSKTYSKGEIMEIWNACKSIQTNPA